ncbi:uncharacterized protein LOC129731309 [Wyeomyia smithii]|uniref:uncharacterized protein LOC129731309 n=1 Tax=Wyeomyia smithii TaxID=174621 RepID=UPI002467F9E7|nr:uncharacterized protein LOC129731309 [Wyeomyia smithii]
MPNANETFLEKCIFSLRLPREPAAGDEIALKLTMKENAKRFSLNLCLARSDDECHPQTEPEQIAYHLGWKFPDADGDDDGKRCEMIQCSKNCTWNEPLVVGDDWIGSQQVTVIVRFHTEMMKVFIEDTQHPPDYEYEHQFPIEEIRSFELWDDVERVEELTLRFGGGYKNGH